MENLSKGIKIGGLLLILLTLLSVFIPYNEAQQEEALLVFFGEMNAEAPSVKILKVDDKGNLESTTTNFPTNIFRFIECCKQDTITFVPVQSYLARTSMMDVYEQQEEEKLFKRKMKKLQVKKRKFIRKWRRSNGIYAVKVNLETCSCIVDDPGISWNELNYLKEIY